MLKWVSAYIIGLCLFITWYIARDQDCMFLLGHTSPTNAGSASPEFQDHGTLGPQGTISVHSCQPVHYCTNFSPWSLVIAQSSLSKAWPNSSYLLFFQSDHLSHLEWKTTQNLNLKSQMTQVLHTKSITLNSSTVLWWESSNIQATTRSKSYSSTCCFLSLTA